MSLKRAAFEYFDAISTVQGENFCTLYIRGNSCTRSNNFIGMPDFRISFYTYRLTDNVYSYEDDNIK